MIKSTTEYEDVVVKILNYVISEQNLSYSEFPECTPEEYNEIFYQCVKDELIGGYSAVGRTADGIPHVQKTGTSFVTFKGFSLMDSIAQARALEIAKSAEKKSIAAKFRANISIIISISAFVATLLINVDKIVHNIRMIISYLSSL